MNDFSTLIAGLSSSVNNKDVRQAIDYILQPAKSEILDKLETTRITTLQSYDQQINYLIDLCGVSAGANGVINKCKTNTPDFVSDSCVYALDNSLDTFVDPNIGQLEVFKANLETVKNYENTKKEVISDTLTYGLV